MILLFFVFPLLLLDYRKSKNTGFSSKAYILFSLYLILVSVAAPLLLNFGGDSKELLSAIEFSIIMFLLIKNKKIGQVFIDTYSNLAVLFAVFLLIQYIAFVFFNVSVTGVIPFLELYNREVESVMDGRLLRICSVFAEPSHFAVYEVPVLIFLLWRKTNPKGRLFRIIIISLSILLCTSSNGIIIMALIYLAIVIQKYFTHFKLSYLIIGSVVLCLAFYIIKESEYIDKITYGLFVQEPDMTMSKAEMRIYRGFNMYADMPLEQKCFGIGWRNARRYCLTCNTSLFSKYSADAFDYFNSIAGTLIYAGIVGLVLLLLFFFSLWKETKDYATKLLILSVFIIMVSSSVLMTDQWVLFLAAITSMININSIKN